MSIEKVRAYFKGYGIEDKILEFPVSSATVELAAKASAIAVSRPGATDSIPLREEVMSIEL